MEEGRRRRRAHACPRPARCSLRQDLPYSDPRALCQTDRACAAAQRNPTPTGQAIRLPARRVAFARRNKGQALSQDGKRLGCLQARLRLLLKEASLWTATTIPPTSQTL